MPDRREDPEFAFLQLKSRYFRSPSEASGVLAQLVERLNGIEEVRGSNPLGSKYLCIKDLDSKYRESNNICPLNLEALTFSRKGSGDTHSRPQQQRVRRTGSSFSLLGCLAVRCGVPRGDCTSTIRSSSCSRWLAAPLCVPSRGGRPARR